MKTCLGIEIGGTKLQIVSGNDRGEISERFRFPVEVSAGASGIRKHIADTIKQLRLRPLSGIGVGFGGPIDWTTGRINTSYHVQGWSGFDLKRWLEDISGAAVAIDNDANVAALGEACYGAGRNYAIVFYVTLGSGVGGGLVINRKVYHGALPGEAEIGHVRLDRNGNTVESLCSGWAVNQKVRMSAERNPGGELARIAAVHRDAEAKALPDAIDAGDNDAARILEETCDDLALGLSHAVHLFHPDIVILGGGLSLIGEPLRTAVQLKLSDYLMDAFLPGPPVSLSGLGEDVVPTGALTLAATTIETV